MIKRVDELFYKMRDLSQENSRIDMHMHTNWTDGKNTSLEMILKAKQNALSSVAITDHIREKSDYYDDYLKELSKISDQMHFCVQAGFEAKIKDLSGEVDISDDAADKADFVVASVHRLPTENGYKYPKDFSKDDLALLEKNLALAAIGNGNKISVMGHCGGMSIATFGAFPIDYFEEVICACKEKEVAFEFNYKYHHDYEIVLKELLYRYNPYVSVGSDAHEVDKIADRSFV